MLPLVDRLQCGQYGSDVVLLLHRTLYGTKLAVLLQFWRELLKSMLKMFYKQSKADPCLFLKWNQEKELSMDIVGG
jgi:hypothetical protein